VVGSYRGKLTRSSGRMNMGRYELEAPYEGDSILLGICKRHRQ
jgi:hypothetical protein